MAQTKRKRRRKHRGTQGGRVDTRPKGRPRTRAEAKQRAQSRGKSGSRRRAAAQGRTVNPPSWRSAALKGLAIAVFFFAIITFAFGEPVASSAILSTVMVAFYIPMAYYTDSFFYNRQLRKQEKARLP
jgi:hypothetical protein